MTLEIKDKRQIFTVNPISPEHKHLKKKIYVFNNNYVHF